MESKFSSAFHLCISCRSFKGFFIALLVERMFYLKYVLSMKALDYSTLRNTFLALFQLRARTALVDRGTVLENRS